MTAKTKLTIYLPKETTDELREAAADQERSLSWLLEFAWRVSKPTIFNTPSVADLVEKAREDAGNAAE